MAQSNYRKLQRELYEAYKANMKFYGRGKEIISFRQVEERGRQHLQYNTRNRWTLKPSLN